MFIAYSIVAQLLDQDRHLLTTPTGHFKGIIMLGQHNMGYIAKLKSYRIARFALVGFANTVVNFAVLNIAFYGLHWNKILSSVIATSCAIAFSFFLNRGFVFRDTSRPVKKFMMFTVVSACGVLIIQTSVYAVCVLLLRHSSDYIAINVSNLIASICVAFWNYNGYRLFVFNGKIHGRNEGQDVEESARETA